MAMQNRWSRLLRYLGRLNLKQIDLGLISLNFVIGLTVFIFPYKNVAFSQDFRFLWMIILGNCLFYGLSCLTPSVSHRLWRKRVYIVICLVSVTIFSLLPPFPDQFLLVFYWWIMKSCILLPLQDCLLIVLVMGVTYVNFSWIGIQPRLQQVIDECSRFALPSDYICAQVDRPGYLFNATILCIGFSTCAILGGRLLKSEQAKRQQSEILSREIQVCRPNFPLSKVTQKVAE